MRLLSKLQSIICMALHRTMYFTCKTLATSKNTTCILLYHKIQYFFRGIETGLVCQTTFYVAIKKPQSKVKVIIIKTVTCILTTRHKYGYCCIMWNLQFKSNPGEGILYQPCHFSCSFQACPQTPLKCSNLS